MTGAYVQDELPFEINPKKTFYLAGPMRQIRNFNVDNFDSAARFLRNDCDLLVLNPCDKDRSDYGPDVFKSETGDLADIAHLKFDLNLALAWDLEFIAKQADGIALLPGWEKSSGARAEKACAEALGKEIVYLDDHPDYGWSVSAHNPVQYLSYNGGKSIYPDEVRTTSSTGGQKGVKPEAYSQIPTGPLAELARCYYKGSLKYDAYNWAKGYEWSKSYSALQRHVNKFWAGEEIDPDDGIHHLAHAAWHCFTLLHYSTHKQYDEFDDRFRQEEYKSV